MNRVGRLGADEGPQHGLELGLRLRPLGIGIRARPRCPRRRRAGPARRRARRPAARSPIRRRRGRRPSRPGRRTDRGRSPRARGWHRGRRRAACRRLRASGAAGGRARAQSAPAPRVGPRMGVARCATGPNTSTSGVASACELVAARREHVDDAVDDEAVLARVLHRCGQGQQGLVAVGDGRTRDRS